MNSPSLANEAEPPAESQTSASDRLSRQALHGTTTGILRADAGCIALLLGLVAAIFWKTIFLGKPIARLSYMADWDSVFDAWKTGASQMIDPSAVLLAYPVYNYIAHLLHAGKLPLWNPLNGCGAPLLADVQTTVMSPLHWFYFLFPNEYCYNLQLVLHVFVASAGAYFLGRTLNARPLVALLCGSAFAFAPYFLWYLELQTGQVFALYPAMLAFFVLVAKRQSMASAAAAGVFAGLVVLAGHPECSLFSVAASTAYLFIYLLLDCESSRSLPNRLLSAVRLTAVAGLCAFCVSAPVLLPFIEFLKNSDCYKFGVTTSAFVPWQAMAYSLIAPGFGGASPFVGSLCAVLLPFALLKRNRLLALPLFAILFGTFLFCAHVPPLDWLLARPPFNYLISVYCVPLAFLCVAALATIGCQSLLDSLENRQPVPRPIQVSAAVIALTAICLPLIFQLLHCSLSAGNFDMTIPDMHVDRAALLRIPIVIALAVLVVAIVRKTRMVAVGAIALVVLNLVSLLPCLKTSLPALSPFRVPKIEVYEQLARAGGRTVAAGGHVANPNVNQLYRFSDLRSRNALWSARYLGLMQILGADVTSYEQRFGARLSPLLDLASVQYVLASQPIVCTGDSEPPLENFRTLAQGPREIAKGVQLVYLAMYTDADNRQTNGYIQFSVEPNSPAASKKAFVLELCDRSGAVVWFSDRFPLDASRTEFNVPIPQGIAAETLSLNVRLVSLSSGQFLPLKDGEQFARLCSLPAGSQCGHHYKLGRELPGNLRLYENQSALPPAYVVFNTMVAVDAADALAKLSSSAFDCHKCAVLEESQPAATGINSVGGASNSDAVPAVVERPGPNEVIATVDTPAAGTLVLTDSFYPGWNAYVDGKPTKIVRANSLFRGVPVAPGHHRVEFKFEPVSVKLGFAIFGAFVAFFTGLIFRRTMGRRFRQQTRTAAGLQEAMGVNRVRNTREDFPAPRK